MAKISKKPRKSLLLKGFSCSAPQMRREGTANATEERRIGPVQERRKALPAILLEGLPLENKMAATYSPACAVPSARSGLTSLFGMGRGGTPTL